jgi:hypothetical protein
MKKKLFILLAACSQITFPITDENRAEIFNSIYKNGVWGVQETRSGYGSRMEATKTIRNVLPHLIEIFQVKTLLDLPCGDFNWMKTVDLGLCTYLGGDIVEDVIRFNQEHYTTANRTFKVIDAVKDAITKVDLVLCRDIVAHLKFEDTKQMLRNLKKSGSTYVLITTYARCPKNCEDAKFPTGEWHPINLTLEPFNFPQPLMIFEESAPVSLDTHYCKSLGLWRLADIDVDGKK